MNLDWPTARRHQAKMRKWTRQLIIEFGVPQERAEKIAFKLWKLGQETEAYGIPTQT